MIRLVVILTLILSSVSSFGQRRLIHVNSRPIYLVDSTHLAQTDSTLSASIKLNKDLESAIIYKDSLLDTLTSQFNVVKSIAISSIETNNELLRTLDVCENKQTKTKSYLKWSITANGLLLLLIIIL